MEKENIGREARVDVGIGIENKKTHGCINHVD